MADASARLALGEVRAVAAINSADAQDFGDVGRNFRHGARDALDMQIIHPV